VLWRGRGGPGGLRPQRLARRLPSTTRRRRRALTTPTPRQSPCQSPRCPWSRPRTCCCPARAREQGPRTTRRRGWTTTTSPRRSQSRSQTGRRSQTHLRRRHPPPQGPTCCPMTQPQPPARSPTHPARPAAAARGGPERARPSSRGVHWSRWPRTRPSPRRPRWAARGGPRSYSSGQWRGWRGRVRLVSRKRAQGELRGLGHARSTRRRQICARAKVQRKRTRLPTMRL
jgi:hypothetical protein